MEYILLIAGFLLLIFSGKYLVQGSVVIANHFNISKLVVGVTIVSFGTSAPELFVGANASFANLPSIALGNVIGSNIANIALVLAITSMIFPIPVRRNSIKIDAPFMLIVSGLLYLLIIDFKITRMEGVIFLVLLVAYLVFIIKKSRKEDVVEELDENMKIPMWLAILFVILSTAGLALGSDLLVDSASKIAFRFGVSERVISITIIAFGTSLPELVTSSVAAFKKEMDISIGNIIGSNIFNILAVLGVSSIVRPLNVAESFVSVDIIWMLGISALLFLFILPLKGGKLTRIKGLVLFLVYGVYIYFLLNKV